MAIGRIDLTFAGSLAAAILAAFFLAACATAPRADGLQQIRLLLPGDYVGDGPTGKVYHRIVPLQVPALGGPIFYHHVSRETFGGASFQRKFYVFDTEIAAMRSTVLLGSVDSMADDQTLARSLSQLSDDDLLKFPDECLFAWSKQEQGFVAKLADQWCAYDSPAFGGPVAPKMTYRLDRCSLAIDEAIYRPDGSPVFPPSSIDNRRVNEALGPIVEC